MADAPQIDYRSALPEAKRSQSPYAYWLGLMNALAVLLLFVNLKDHRSFTVALAIVAAALLAMSFAAIRDMRRTGRTGVVAVTFAIALGLLAGTGAVSSATAGQQRREGAHRLVCANNLRVIGLTATLYKADHGTWPSSLDDLAKRVEPQRLSCPFETSGRRYYFIAPKTHDPKPEVIVAFELPSHKNVMNVLLSDCTVQPLKEETALRVLAELAAGQNPPPSMTTK